MSKMRNRGRYAGLIATLLMGFVSISARAEVVTQQLFEAKSTLVTGANINVAEFNLTTPGVLTIKLTDLKWPALLGTLSFSVLDTTHVLQTFSSNGVADNTWTFNVVTPGTFYGAIYAKPSAAAGAGMYYANVSYQNVSAVPLPAAAWFLFSGIAGLVALRPKQKLSQI